MKKRNTGLTSERSLRRMVPKGQFSNSEPIRSESLDPDNRQVQGMFNTAQAGGPSMDTSIEFAADMPKKKRKGRL